VVTSPLPRLTREDLRDELGLDLRHNVLNWDSKRIKGSFVWGSKASFFLAYYHHRPYRFITVS
jgi:hypothetical protein